MTTASVLLSAGLRPYVDQAFTRERVRIDFVGFSGDTLRGVAQELLDKIRAGEINPKSVTIRLLFESLEL